jgi:hypothetical protein
MTKKEKVVIKEIIEFLLNTRTRELAENEENFHMVNSFPQYEENHFDLEEANKATMERYDSRLIALNNLLKQEERNKEVLDIEAEMRKIQAKKYITTDEMVEIYNISISSQRDYRGRLNDPLPFNQKKFRGKITYTVEEIEKWLKNQGK